MIEESALAAAQLIKNIYINNIITRDIDRKSIRNNEILVSFYETNIYKKSTLIGSTTPVTLAVLIVK